MLLFLDTEFTNLQRPSTRLTWPLLLLLAGPRHTTSLPDCSATPMLATIPEEKPRKSASIPPLNFTPFSGISERNISFSFSPTRPNTMLVCEVRLGKGSRTANCRMRSSLAQA